MGLYKRLRENWQKPSEEMLALQRKRLVEWRTQNTTVRIERPTRLDRARSLGYRAKQGVILVRQRVDRGGRMRPSIRSGRRSAHNYQHKNLNKTYQQVAEERTNEVYKNCEVLNSYEVGRDALSAWYEVILVDRDHPVILEDPQYVGIALQRGRANRGITSAGRKSRGLRNKGLGAEKMRPSVKAHDGRAN